MIKKDYLLKIGYIKAIINYIYKGDFNMTTQNKEIDYKIIFFIGPSSSGKDTFFRYVLNTYPIKPIILSTTRPMRPGEVEGKEYYFISQEQMNELEKNNLLIERRDFNTVHGIWSYATTKNQIDLSRSNYVTPNTWKAYELYLQTYQKEQLFPIYFELDEGVRFERALHRERISNNHQYSEMCRRFLADCEDFPPEKLDIHKPVIIDNNGTYEETTEQIDDVFTRKLKIHHLN